MAETDIDRSTLENQNRDVVYERHVEKVIEDQDASHTLDENQRPGLLDGAPFVPPVAYSGPNAGVGNLGGAGTGTGPVGIPIPVVPVIEGGDVDTGVLVNPFTPADPDNDKPFEADIVSPADLAARVEAELAADGRLAAADLSITSDDGVITLAGTAPSADLAADAANAVARLPGVNGVVNNIRATN